MAVGTYQGVAGLAPRLFTLVEETKGQCKDRGGCATLRVSSTLIARWNAGC